MGDENITISRKKYDRLIARSRMLSRLEAAGVDSWEGYDEALSSDSDD